MSKIRLDKYISSQTALTRSEAVIAIYRNRVTVNGRIKKDGAIKVDTEKDEVCLDGEQLVYEEFVYYMLNKPQGVISATEDNQHKTVVELIDTSREIAPVGRLDIDTEGLLLLTDDGKLTHELLSPKKHVDKTYYAEVDGEITADVVKGFEEGIEYGGEEGIIVISFDAVKSSLERCLAGDITLCVECNPLHGPRVANLIRSLEAGNVPQKKSYIIDTFFSAESITEEMIKERPY